jgi:hypothetical protein
VENDIQAYIRENRAAYTREAITTQLQAAGHGEADIEAAWAAIEAEEAAAAPPRPSGRSWGLTVGVAFAYVGASLLIFLIWVILIFILASVSGSGALVNWLLFSLPALYLLAIIFGVRQGLTRPAATAAATGHLIGAAFMALPLIISGICAASLTRLG